MILRVEGGRAATAPPAPGNTTQLASRDLRLALGLVPRSLLSTNFSWIFLTQTPVNVQQCLKLMKIRTFLLYIFNMTGQVKKLSSMYSALVGPCSSLILALQYDVDTRIEKSYVNPVVFACYS